MDSNEGWGNQNRKRPTNTEATFNNFKRPPLQYYEGLASKQKNAYVHSLTQNMFKERSEKYSCVDEGNLANQVDLPRTEECATPFINENPKRKKDFSVANTGGSNFPTNPVGASILPHTATTLNSSTTTATNKNKSDTFSTRFPTKPSQPVGFTPSSLLTAPPRSASALPPQPQPTITVTQLPTPNISSSFSQSNVPRYSARMKNSNTAEKKK